MQTGQATASTAAKTAALRRWLFTASPAAVSVMAKPATSAAWRNGTDSDRAGRGVRSATRRSTAETSALQS